MRAGSGVFVHMVGAGLLRLDREIIAADSVL